MKILFRLIIICISLNTFGQEGITFEIEKLSKPDNLLFLRSSEDIYKSLILKDAKISEWEVKRNKIDFNYNIIAKSLTPDSLVNFGYNSFFYGMYQAYADHRPFVLSPDIIWLLISQGFSRHVNANPEKLRKYFVDFSGKLSLVVETNDNLLEDSQKWEDIFPQFTSQISEHTGKELIQTLSCDFSTTGSIEKVASEITIMEAMEPYFEFVVMYVICGIPEIKLLGTTDDWKKILDKTRKLGDYNLKWWTNELEPVLKEFINASKGNINKRFWRNMFKYHSKKKYGAPQIINGWIVKFFPYDKDGRRNNLKTLNRDKALPEEIVKVDLKYIKNDGLQNEEIMLELWAGFIGLEQNPDNFALTPQISWMIKKKDLEQSALHQILESNNIPSATFEPAIDLNIINVPENLKKFDVIYSLGLHFKNDVFIPDWLKTKRIGKLFIEGKISAEEKQKIIDFFPSTELNINGKKYNEGKNGWYQVSDNKIPETILNLDKIWILELWNHEYENNKLIIPDELGNIEIENFALVNDTSGENIERLKRLLPNSKIYMNGLRIQ